MGTGSNSAIGCRGIGAMSVGSFKGTISRFSVSHLILVSYDCPSESSEMKCNLIPFAFSYVKKEAAKIELKLLRFAHVDNPTTIKEKSKIGVVKKE
jgi:hypothetical protein